MPHVALAISRLPSAPTRTIGARGGVRINVERGFVPSGLVGEGLGELHDGVARRREGEREKGWGSSREGKLGLFEPAVANRSSDLKDPVSAARRPTHLALLVHAGIDEAVGSTFGGRTGNRLT